MDSPTPAISRRLRQVARRRIRSNARWELTSRRASAVGRRSPSSPRCDATASGSRN